MVWFQCEDCGDNLKKPKLPSHFRVCSAFKLSCIDCGQVFGQHDVETHTQCITEMEKYGPKGQGKALNGSNTKPKNNNAKPKPEVDINVGLSDRPPWFCSLCNTSATSKQTLLSHADGKKHRGKARGFHAAKQLANDTKETKDLTESNATNEVPDNKVLGEAKDQNSEVSPLPTVENDATKSNKKRKLVSDKDGVQNRGDISAELNNGEVVQIKDTETKPATGLKKAKHSGEKEEKTSDSTSTKDSGKKEIKWKKLITSALKSNPNGALKLKKLQKVVANSLEESGVKEDKKRLSEVLEQKVNSSSRFILDGKYVRLAATA